MPVTFRLDPSQMHRAEMMSITSQATARVWVICTVPKTGTFSKVARIRAPLIDTSIKRNHLIIYELLSFEGFQSVVFRAVVLSHGFCGGVTFGKEPVAAVQEEDDYIGEQNGSRASNKVDGLQHEAQHHPACLQKKTDVVAE